MPDEIWRPVAGHEGSYEVSNMGRVRSVDRAVEMLSRWGKPVVKRLRGRVLKPGTDLNGYLFIFLGAGNIRRIHRLVADAFVGKVDEEVVNHLNGVRSEAAAKNLEWTTTSGNNLHAFRVLRRKPSHQRAVTVAKGGAGTWFPSVAEAARDLACGYQTLYWALANTQKLRGHEVHYG